MHTLQASDPPPWHGVTRAAPLARNQRERSARCCGECRRRVAVLSKLQRSEKLDFALSDCIPYNPAYDGPAQRVPTGWPARLAGNDVSHTWRHAHDWRSRRSSRCSLHAARTDTALSRPIWSPSARAPPSASPQPHAGAPHPPRGASLAPEASPSPRGRNLVHPRPL